MDCNASNSALLPSVCWFNSDGDMVSDDRHLEIMDIQRNQAGMYTCVATYNGTTMNSTVNVIVHCEFYD